MEEGAYQIGRRVAAISVDESQKIRMRHADVIRRLDDAGVTYQ